MIENHIKAELINELKKSENFVEHYPTIRANKNDKPINELILFYSKKPIFKSKIYIFQLDCFPIIHSKYFDSFEEDNLIKAVDFLFKKHHIITTIDSVDKELNK
jgi:hypothetical protein